MDQSEESQIFINPPAPLLHVSDARYKAMCAWNDRLIDELVSMYEEHAKGNLQHSMLETKLEEVVAGYNENCVLDVLPYFTKNLWHKSTAEEGLDFISLVSNLHDEIIEGSSHDIVTHLFYEWTDTESVLLWMELLQAFEKTARRHKLFSNARRMAYLLIEAVMRSKMLHLVLLISYISDDTWRDLCVLALTDDIPSHLARWILIDICFIHGKHAITKFDLRLLNKNSEVENAYVRMVYDDILRHENDDLRAITSAFAALPDTIGILRWIENDEISEITEDDPEFNTPGFDWLDDHVFEKLEKVMRQAGRRLCRGMIFRIVIGLVGTNPELPQYVILPIVEKALPSCIYTNQAGTVTGLMSRAAVVRLIESVMRFYARRENASSLPRNARQRIYENQDDDNEF